jgi:Ca2+-binding EF-hand superfamily protein
MRITTYLTTGIFALTALALTEPAAAQRRADFRTARAFQMLDTDNNGSITLAEFRAGLADEHRGEAQAHFRRIDRDGDGAITSAELRDEWPAALKLLRPEIYERGEIADARVQEAAFAAMDADGDDFVSLEEFQAAARPRAQDVGRMFRRLDANNDNRLSRGELEGQWDRLRGLLKADIYLAAAGPASPQDRAFKSMDANADGTLSFQEYRNGLKEDRRADARQTFDRFDTDEDRSLSSEEFAQAWEGLGDLVRSELINEPDAALGVERAEDERP